MTNVPVLFLIFNRPAMTARVFEAIRQAQPAQLFLAADGPRPGRLEDSEKCAATRQIVSQVDWKCAVTRNYSVENLGCGKRISSAITWFFENVEHGIIFEDDCLPHPTFFPFCEELLTRFHDDKRIMHIAGSNYQFGHGRDDYSYHFSNAIRIGGWATWRRAWSFFDFEMRHWEEVLEKGLLANAVQAESELAAWIAQTDRTYRTGSFRRTWAAQWLYSCLLQRGLAVVPNVNLISNIGFGEDSTHTKDNASEFANMPTAPMQFPLRHPAYVMDDPDSERHRYLMSRRPLMKRLVSRATRFVARKPGV